MTRVTRIQSQWLILFLTPSLLAGCAATPVMLRPDARPLNRAFDARIQWTNAVNTAYDAVDAGLVPKATVDRYFDAVSPSVNQLLDAATAVAKGGGDVGPSMESVRAQIRSLKAFLQSQKKK